MSEENERPRRGGTARIASDDNGHGEVRRTERLSPNGDDWSQREPVNPGWRRERTTSARTTRRGRSGLPTSPQEFQLWLQAGGWRYVAGITALLFVLLIAMLAYGRNDQRDTRFGIEDQKAPTSFAGVGSALTPLALPTITLAPTLPPTPTFFTVTGTDGLGLFLRPNPSSEG
ncbi:MAG: hypothetical protein HGA19_11450, partial [Oscillochloris sp.]|nr:hypothetical protein [Oscillochloris sp.]